MNQNLRTHLESDVIFAFALVQCKRILRGIFETEKETLQQYFLDQQTLTMRYF